MRDFKGDLVRSYDNDAPARDGRVLPDERIAFRRRFVDLLRNERRSNLIEFGAGVGQDAAALAAEGLGVVALDLSPANIEKCRERGIEAQVGDFYDTKFPEDSFDAGWAMSSLLHVPNDDIDAVLVEIARVLQPGAPLAIGLWGGTDTEGLIDDEWLDPPRFFSMRTDDHLRRILERHFCVDLFETGMFIEGHDEHYQWCIVRTDPSAQK